MPVKLRRVRAEKRSPRRRRHETLSAVKFVIVHNHFRPGGVRRVIELAAPHLLRELPSARPELILATGEAPDAPWLDGLRARLPGGRVSCWVDPVLGYLAEQPGPQSPLRQQLRRFWTRHLAGLTAADCLIWAHNQGLGRNLLLTRELVRQCAARNLPLVLHHHDWWFDNRWQRWPETRRAGFRSLRQVAEVVFSPAPNVRHAAINRHDYVPLRNTLGARAGWLPNLMPRGVRPDAAKTRAARRWLAGVTGEKNAPIWLVPCRLLRRKNLAEALLLTRWLRPEGWLVTTGGVSSADERAYHAKFQAAARRHHWRIRLGVLAGSETAKPSVPALLAASEAILLTSVQEGFGLPYLEAATAGRPLIARRLPNVAPDLKTFGFQLPQLYTEVRVPVTLLDWERERARQTRFFQAWLRLLPPGLRRLAPPPPLLARARPPASVAFSRLTLSAQLEVLAHPAEVSWQACVDLNPFLTVWRRRALTQKLRVSPWPRTADRWLSPRAYAARFAQLLRARVPTRLPADAAMTAQQEFLVKTLAGAHRHPLLWHTNT